MPTGWFPARPTPRPIPSAPHSRSLSPPRRARPFQASSSWTSTTRSSSFPIAPWWKTRPRSSWPILRSTVPSPPWPTTFRRRSRCFPIPPMAPARAKWSKRFPKPWSWPSRRWPKSFPATGRDSVKSWTTGPRKARSSKFRTTRTKPRACAFGCRFRPWRSWRK